MLHLAAHRSEERLVKVTFGTCMGSPLAVPEALRSADDSGNNRRPGSTSSRVEERRSVMDSAFSVGMGAPVMLIVSSVTGGAVVAATRYMASGHHGPSNAV